MRPMKLLFQAGSAMAIALVLPMLLGCASTPNAKAPSFDVIQGAHPADWVTTHWAAYIANPSQCTPCHDSAAQQPTTAPQAGVTCFGCHHPAGPNHDANWNLPVPTPAHGLAAMGVAAPAFDPSAPAFPMQGFASCVPCHGALYNNAAAGYAPSCYSCHTTAPHPPKPWGANLGLPDTQPRHDLVDLSNAPECFKCHAGGANSDITPVTPAAAGTVPGCFNGTLCHNTHF